MSRKLPTILKKSDIAKQQQQRAQKSARIAPIDEVCELSDTIVYKPSYVDSASVLNTDTTNNDSSLSLELFWDKNCRNDVLMKKVTIINGIQSIQPLVIRTGLKVTSSDELELNMYQQFDDM
ncbi:Hypothetical_protein [Hexamita inflata]|uniref:Hypothetical_protein n=1 Tax=Hexamita inflata TaxID=28002 RepID=A0AA86P6B6_9EUKA|nr:Hypothetical protein HINF_LOCUS20143 [Hexamita inflata]